MTPARFAAAALAEWPADVSRETLARLSRHEALLRKWQARINLVGPATLADVWRRHFLDSAQLFSLLPAGAERVIDLGSGAGFPGLVLAILAKMAERPIAFDLVESDARKAAFLIEAVRETGVGDTVRVHAARAETLPGRLPLADVVTARAVAPLAELVPLAAPLLKRGGFCLFLKGAKVDKELTALGRTWNMVTERVASRSDSSGTVLLLKTLQPRSDP